MKNSTKNKRFLAQVNRELQMQKERRMRRKKELNNKSAAAFAAIIGIIWLIITIILSVCK